MDMASFVLRMAWRVEPILELRLVATALPAASDDADVMRVPELTRDMVWCAVLWVRRSVLAARREVTLLMRLIAIGLSCRVPIPASFPMKYRKG